MSEDLNKILKKEKYTQLKFKISKSNHLLIKGSINGVKGIFILDTGASNSCVHWDKIEHYNLNAKTSKTKASGAGAIDMEAQISQHNTLKIGRWQTKSCQLVIFDLSHVNTALVSYGLKPVDGIIGSDVLKLGKALIDYNQKVIYLKKLK